MGNLYRRWGKRTIDLVVSVGTLVVLAPAIAVIAVSVRMFLGAPVLFRQQRPGLHGRPFLMLKFRTMSDARDAQGHLLPDGERLSPFGRFLRRTSLDELPGIWNILRGDLSFVGPRPLLMQYLPRYTAAQARRHEVRPGITGLAQVSGRNALSWDERFRLDVLYVDSLSFGLDVKILWKTLQIVLQRKGVSSAGQATMYEFLGQGPGSGARIQAPVAGGDTEAPANKPAKGAP